VRGSFLLFHLIHFHLLQLFLMGTEIQLQISCKLKEINHTKNQFVLQFSISRKNFSKELLETFIAAMEKCQPASDSGGVDHNELSLDQVGRQASGPLSGYIAQLALTMI